MTETRTQVNNVGDCGDDDRSTFFKFDSASAVLFNRAFRPTYILLPGLCAWTLLGDFRFPDPLENYGIRPYSLYRKPIHNPSMGVPSIFELQPPLT